MQQQRLDMNRIAAILGAQRLGKVRASGGYLGALQLVAEIKARFRVPRHGGRPTDPHWTERRLVGLSTKTLHRLQEMAARLSKAKHTHVNAMQLAALLLEQALDNMTELPELDEEATDTTTPSRKASGQR